MPVLERLGLMADLDTPEDLLFARAHGLVMP
jgi:2-phospho-L-lactate guanylyltransferase (CobY/MobA/RfbA family)